MHARWVAEGNDADLPIYPGGAHGFTLFPNDLSKSATARMDAGDRLGPHSSKSHPDARQMNVNNAIHRNGG